MKNAGGCADTLATNSGLNEWKANEELEILSHITSVLYVSYPKDMQGGHLVLWPPRRNIEHTYYEDVLPAHVLRPQVCLLLLLFLNCIGSSFVHAIVIFIVHYYNY